MLAQSRRRGRVSHLCKTRYKKKKSPCFRQYKVWSLRGQVGSVVFGSYAATTIPPKNKHRNLEKPKNETENTTNFRKAQNTQKPVKSRKGETEKQMPRNHPKTLCETLLRFSRSGTDLRGNRSLCVFRIFLQSTYESAERRPKHSAGLVLYQIRYQTFWIMGSSEKRLISEKVHDFSAFGSTYINP